MKVYLNGNFSRFEPSGTSSSTRAWDLRFKSDAVWGFINPETFTNKPTKIFSLTFGCPMIPTPSSPRVKFENIPLSGMNRQPSGSLYQNASGYLDLSAFSDHSDDLTHRSLFDSYSSSLNRLFEDTLAALYDTGPAHTHVNKQMKHTVKKPVESDEWAATTSKGINPFKSLLKELDMQNSLLFSFYHISCSVFSVFQTTSHPSRTLELFLVQLENLDSIVNPYLSLL